VVAPTDDVGGALDGALAHTDVMLLIARNRAQGGEESGVALAWPRPHRRPPRFSHLGLPTEPAPVARARSPTFGEA
jgi:hypothetical protein